MPAPASPQVPGRHSFTLTAVGAGLAGFSFLVGFLPFYTSGNNGISGYALGTPTSAAIGFSVFAGLLCSPGLLRSTRSGNAASLDVTGAAAAAVTALLLAVANLLSKGALSGDVSFGFVLFLLGLLAQAGVLLSLWLAASRVARSFPSPGCGQADPSNAGPPADPYGSRFGGAVNSYPGGMPPSADPGGVTFGPFYPPPH